MLKFSHAIVFVSDMARSVAFYRDILGLPLRFESPEWTEFDTPGSTLALHLADGPAIPSQQHGSQRANASLGFRVEDIDAFHQEMIAKGVTCLQPPEEEDFGDSWPSMPIPMGCRSRWWKSRRSRDGWRPDSAAYFPLTTITGP